MTPHRPGSATTLACLALALLVHAGAMLALAAERSAPPPEPESAIELELTAVATSEAVPSDIQAVAAAPEQAPEAQDVMAGGAATVIANDSPDTVDAPASPPADAVADHEQLQPATDTPPEAKDVARDPPAAIDIAPATPAIVTSDTEQVAVQEEDVPDSRPALAKAMAPPRPAVPKREPVKPVTETKTAMKKAQARPMVAGARESASATQAGKSTAIRSGGQALASSYRSAVAARINGRKGAIASRVPSGARGTVLISFVIGPGGAVNRSAVRQSSGVRAIDAAALSTIAATLFPPPPDGSFAAVVPIEIN